ncbi:unnamed protein product, partial [Ceratitis capitata]
IYRTNIHVYPLPLLMVRPETISPFRIEQSPTEKQACLMWSDLFLKPPLNTAPAKAAAKMTSMMV